MAIPPKHKKIFHYYDKNGVGDWTYFCNGAYTVNWQKTNMHGKVNCKNCLKRRSK